MLAERGQQRHHVAVLVDHGQVGGLAFAGCGRCGVAGGAAAVVRPGVAGHSIRVGAVGADQAAAFVGKAARQDPADRQLGAVGVAQVGEAVQEGQALRLGDQVQLLGAARCAAAQVQALQDGQRLHHGRVPGVVQPADHLVAVVAAAQTAFRITYPVAGQIVQRQQAALGLHVGSDHLGDAAAVEGIGAVGGNGAQRAGQIGLAEDVPLHTEHRRAVTAAIGAEHHPAAFGKPLQPVLVDGHAQGDVPVQRKPLLGMLDGRGHHVGARQLPETRLCLQQAGRHARHGRRQVTGVVGIVDHFGPAIDAGGRPAVGKAELVGPRGGRQRAGAVEHMRLAGPGLVVDQHRDAAQAAVERLGHAGCKTCRHGGIDGIAAPLQHRDTGLGGLPDHGGHHAGVGGHLGLANQPLATLCHGASRNC